MMTHDAIARRALWAAAATSWTAAVFASIAVLAELIPSSEAIAARSYLHAVQDGQVRDLPRGGTP